MSKKKNKQRGPVNRPSTPNTSPASNNNVSDEDKKLLELAKAAKKDNELDIQEFISLLESDYASEYEKKKQAVDAEIEKEKAQKQAEFELQLKKDNEELLSNNADLENELKSKRKEVDELDRKAKDFEKEHQAALEKAKEDADKIIADAKDEAEKQNKAAQEEIDKQREQLQDERKQLGDDLDELENKQMEFEAKEIALSARERQVDKLKEIYETANPDVVDSLEKRVATQKDMIDSITAEFNGAQKELNKLKVRSIHADGVSPEELQAENDQLLKKVEQLENKCNRYTDFELNEMKNALDEKDGYLTQIRNLTNEVSSNKQELTRLRNSNLEAEQLQAQMELLRTLNDHLKSELDNTKRMLESNVGDICPALTGIDIEESSDTSDSFTRYNERKDKLNEDKIKNLPELVQHVKRFAASQAKPLFYSERDLRAFIAGMASSPLAILQGMSGTGKSSLPKVFSKAIFGEINVVPVESSWRDRNELLGYYNDFSKKFTAKEFTCDLYRAGSKRYQDAIYFIVLDEMNLSRVEYYFADFLSVLEGEKENWLIKLVDTDMRQLPTEITPEVIKALEKDKSDRGKELRGIVEKLYKNDELVDESTEAVSNNEKLQLITYLSDKGFMNKTKTRGLVGGPQNLINGNTIRIPQNVWFIGTANRDESTFEITDKVYDRAQILNFNSRAKGVKINEDVPQVYLTYSQLMKMFRTALKDYAFNAEDNEALQKVEGVLKKYFRISYGNRIQDQMNTFVPVYVMAGKTPRMSAEKQKELEIEAIDYQLTNKVLRKLEYEDVSPEAASELRKIFEHYQLTMAKDFIDWKNRGEET